MTRKQLLALGVDSSRIARWLADGRLRRVHNGVYAVGYLARSVQAEYAGAVLACGSRAWLSHRAEGHLVKVLQTKFPPPPEVTVATTSSRRRPGITVHRVTAMHRLDTWEYDGIPERGPNASFGAPRAGACRSAKNDRGAVRKRQAMNNEEPCPQPRFPPGYRCRRSTRFLPRHERRADGCPCALSLEGLRLDGGACGRSTRPRL